LDGAMLARCKGWTTLGPHHIRHKAVKIEAERWIGSAEATMLVGPLFRSSRGTNMSAAPANSDLLFFIERGTGPPLLLLHGLMITGEMFEPVIEHFATRHRIIVPDLRGHGRSRSLPPPYTASQIASDLSRLLDHLSVKSTAVLGYSQGGAIAQQFAIDHPTRCSRLVLHAPTPLTCLHFASGSRAISCRFSLTSYG